MQYRVPKLLLGALGLASSCQSESPGCNPDRCDDAESGCVDEGTLVPYRELEWSAEAAVPFPYITDDGEVLIADIIIGGEQYMDNFANRGDVIVDFTLEQDEIRIYMRRFTMARDEAEAHATFEGLSLWAYDTNTDRPERPEAMDPTSKCTEGPWRDGCAIRVYFEGMKQPLRSGADLKIELPKRYRHAISVTTEDAIETGYNNRGNVCIDGLAGSADVRLGDGVGQFVIADATEPVPTCSPADNDACEDADWNTLSGACPCVSGNQIPFGSLRVRGGATDVLVDAPSDLWVSVSARNEGPAEAGCTADVDLPRWEYDADTVGNAETRPPDEVKGWANRPPVPSLLGGYAIEIAANRCAPVSFTEAPSAFEPDDEFVDLRGHAFVGHGFIRDSPCELRLDRLGE